MFVLLHATNNSLSLTVRNGLVNKKLIGDMRNALHECLLNELRRTHHDHAAATMQKLTTLIERLHELVSVFVIFFLDFLFLFQAAHHVEQLSRLQRTLNNNAALNLPALYTELFGGDQH